MTTWHEAILSKLNGYTGFDLDFDDHHIVVVCKNRESFDVSIKTFGDQFQVGFDGWHEHFRSEEEALNCFAFGLSRECRLKVTKRGKIECSWTVQAWQNGRWVEDTTTGLILVPFWRSKQIEYRSNVITQKRVTDTQLSRPSV